MLAHLVARASAGERSGPRQGLGLHMPEASEKGDVRERPPEVRRGLKILLDDVVQYAGEFDCLIICEPKYKQHA